MRFSKILIIFYVVLGVHLTENYALFEIYANVSVAIAHYFSSNCIYVLTHADKQDSPDLFCTAKYISLIHKKFIAKATISNYFLLLNQTSDLDVCYMPLHVVIDDNHDLLMQEAISFHSTSMSALDRKGGIWLFYLKTLDQYTIDHYFRDIETPFDGEMIVASLVNDQVVMKEVYRVAPGFPLRQSHFGDWSLDKGLRGPQNPMPYFRRKDLEGFEFVVGYAEIPPMTVREKDGFKKHLRGYIGDVWNVIQSSINASSRFVESNELGAKSGNTWTGLVGQLVYNQIDVAVSPFILTRDRFDLITFTHPLIETKFQVFFQLPGSSIDSAGFLLPFATDVWLSIGAWLLSGSLVLFCTCRYSESRFDEPTDKKFTFGQSFLVTFKGLCGQGSDEIPKKNPARLIFLLTFILSTVLIPCYSANLVSYLTVAEPEIPFTNIKEFYEKKIYKMLLRSGSYEYDFFEQESIVDPYIEKIYRRDLKVKSKLPQTNRQGISMLCENKFLAFFGIDASIEWNLEKTREQREKSNCIITKMINEVTKISIGIALPNNSPFKGLINHEIRRLQFLGILERIKKNYWVKYENKPKDTWTPVNLQSCLMIFAILGVGILVASGIFFIEFLLRCKKKRYEIGHLDPMLAKKRIENH